MFCNTEVLHHGTATGTATCGSARQLRTGSVRFCTATWRQPLHMQNCNPVLQRMHLPRAVLHPATVLHTAVLHPADATVLHLAELHCSTVLHGNLVTATHGNTAIDSRQSTHGNLASQPVIVRYAPAREAAVLQSEHSYNVTQITL